MPPVPLKAVVVAPPTMSLKLSSTSYDCPEVRLNAGTVKLSVETPKLSRP